ncbi:hypothetical protein DdX_12620 [Ditylenchus destructor]|uniref:Uncharacterized protein n=1 Tax=Ditylenchus destructor TaxID=166010 RepID=A0AAD4R3F5_9BILA|nr:hypothetical protein DdX_12620 [Ditylenchus destructor]
MSGLSCTRSVVTRMGSRRFQDLSSENNGLCKIANLIQVLVKSRFPATISLADVLDVIDGLEPRLSLYLMDTIGISYALFLKLYCPSIRTSGNAINSTLVWNNNGARQKVKK